MKYTLIKASRYTGMVLLILILASGCKSHKKAAELAKAKQAQLDQEAALQKQQEDQKKKDAADAQARQEAEEARKKQQDAEKASAPNVKLSQYFDAIAGSSNVSAANSNIQEALNMFASPQTPVLIIISGTGDQKDYDKPTTIGAYLNYLKDQKKNINKIENIQFDTAGKISELELRK